MQIYEFQGDRMGQKIIGSIARRSLAVITVVIVTFVISLPVMADTDVTASKEEEGSWSIVGRELGDVADAVGMPQKRLGSQPRKPVPRCGIRPRKLGRMWRMVLVRWLMRQLRHRKVSGRRLRQPQQSGTILPNRQFTIGQLLPLASSLGER